MEFHPIANVFPLMEGKDFKELVASIKTNGLRHPITTYENAILDGRNRYRGCKEAGVSPIFEAFKGRDPYVFVWDENVNRRHLNESQRSLAKVEMSTLAKKGTNQHLPQGRGSTAKEAAKEAGVSVRTIERAKVVHTEGNADTIEKVKRGTLTVGRAAREIEKDKRTKAEAERAKGVADRTERYQLIRGDFEFGDVAPESLDCIITDPPYPREFIELYAVLAKKASEWLKPGGSLLAMAGQTHLPEVLKALTSGTLQYHWTVAYVTPGGQAHQSHPRKVQSFWKPVFWLVKGAYKGDWIGDVAQSKPNDNDKRFHHWGQSESGMADLVRRFSKPGDKICDPFMGGGTTGVVALDLNRFFIGIEKDEKTFAIAKARIGGSNVEAAAAA